MADSAYPWEPPYGGGLPEKIGDVLEPLAVQSDVFQQLLQEASVSRSPLPTVQVTSIASGGATIGITYQDQSGITPNFVFDLG